MDKEKQSSCEENDGVMRESLIVPDEIFAPAPTAEPDDSDDEKQDGGFDESDEALPLTDGQISFFAQDDTEDEAQDEEKVSILERFEEKDECAFDPKAPRLIDKIFDFVELFAFTIATVFVLTTLVFRHAIVDGPSMDKTLAHGEHLIISDLFYEPERGDIIVFDGHAIGNEKLNKPIVKRVIALAGDSVEIDTDTGTVYVNGNAIDESGYRYLSGNTYIDNEFEHIYAVNGAYTVPEGHVFVLGDNRNNSSDSRSFGPINKESILGEVKFRIFPFDSFGTVD